MENKYLSNNTCSTEENVREEDLRILECEAGKGLELPSPAVALCCSGREVTVLCGQSAFPSLCRAEMKFGAVDGEGICPAKEMAFWQRANKKRLETGL